MKLNRKFFERDTLVVAKELLGKYLFRELKTNDKRLKIFIGKIVETEAYIGEGDLACHASKGRTSRTQIMYGEAGHAYIYMIYGMYHCLNIVTEKVGFPAAVLIRAVEPIVSSAVVSSTVAQKDFGKIASGPGKLCRWMEITRDLNEEDVTKSEKLFIMEELSKNVILASEARPESFDSGQAGMTDKKTFEIVKAKRIGVDYAKHCADHLWRFYIKDNEFVSKSER